MLPSVPLGRTSAFGSIPVRAEISESAWSESAQTFAQNCIRRCNQNHDICELGGKPLPTRVIEVGNVGDKRLRLVETQESTNGQYTALSYCWGGDEQLETTFANIEEMTSGFLLSQLPQTLADAVHITRSLHIQYLWVDALCIIQDSVRDWERHSEHMSTIYQNAYLVIAASSSVSARQGFLELRRAWTPYHHVRLPSSCGAQTIVAARRDPESGLHSVSFELKSDPLDGRAWAFQEQLMSTRCLIFSADELQWICKTETVCECGRPTPFLSYRHRLRAYCDDKHQDIAASTGLPHQAADVWRKAVSHYSHGRLSRSDDKLPAISGIASRFGAKLGFRYVAGLWLENIIQDLTWRRKFHLLPFPTGYRAPTFSWASIDDVVDYPGFSDSFDPQLHWTPYSSLSSAGAEVPGHNPFGKVSDAWITLQGPILEGFLERFKDEPHHLLARFRFDDWGPSVVVVLDSAVAEFRYTSEDKGKRRSMRRYNSRQLHEENGSERFEEGDEPPKHAEPAGTHETMHLNFSRASVWLLHLGRGRRTEDQAGRQESASSNDFFLVLGKSPRDPQKYERIGLGVTGKEELLAEHHRRFTTQTVTIL